MTARQLADGGVVAVAVGALWLLYARTMRRVFRARPQYVMAASCVLAGLAALAVAGVVTFFR